MKQISAFLTIISLVFLSTSLKAEVAIVDEGKTLIVTDQPHGYDLKALAATIRDNPGLRSVHISWTLPKEEPQFDALQDVTKEWGSHVESLSVNLQSSWPLKHFGSEAPSQCLNWLAALCPRVKELNYKTEYFFPTVADWSLSVWPTYSLNLPELKVFKLVGITPDTETSGLDQLLRGMKNLQTLDLDLGPWSAGPAFISLLKSHVPHIETVIIRDHGLLQDPDRYINLNSTTYHPTHLPMGVTPGWEYFDGLSELADLRMLHLGILRGGRGIDLQFLQIPKLSYLKVNEIDALSLADISKLLAGSPELRHLYIGGSRHRLKTSTQQSGKVAVEVRNEPHYCKVLFSPIEPKLLSDKLEVLHISFATGFDFGTLIPLLNALPNLVKLEFQNCPGVTTELLAEVQAVFPELEIVHLPSLPVGIIDSWTYELDYDD